MTNEVKENRAYSCISAENTGALVVAGLFVVGRTKGIDRPALSPTLPTKNGKGVLFLDVGANVDAKLNHLLRSEEHTSELQSRGHLVCRLLLEKKIGALDESVT